MMNEASGFPNSSVSPRPTFTGPRTFGEILDRTFQLLRANLRLMIGIASVPAAAILMLYILFAGGMALTGIWTHPATVDPRVAFSIMVPAILVACIPIMMVFALFAAAACYAAAEADAGVRVTIREVYRMAWRRKGRHIGLLLWIYVRAFFPALAVFGLMSSVVGLFSFEPALHPGPALFLLFPLGMLLYIAAYVYGIVVVLRLSLAFPACVVEGVTARIAMQRSGLLTQGAKGRIFLMLLVIHVICYVFFLAFYLISAILAATGFFLSLTMHLHLAAPWSFIGLGFVGVCVVIVVFLWLGLTWAGLATAISVLYNDQRVRKEGYDIERMMHAAGLNAPGEGGGNAGLVAGDAPGEPAQ